MINVHSLEQHRKIVEGCIDESASELNRIHFEHRV